jgi:hypothetical protein
MTLRTGKSLPPKGSYAGLRPDPFPDQAASLLPGLLAATRTGLTPAGDDELALDEVTYKHHPQLWAHERTRYAGCRMVKMTVYGNRELPHLGTWCRSFGAHVVGEDVGAHAAASLVTSSSLDRKERDPLDCLSLRVAIEPWLM